MSAAANTGWVGWMLRRLPSPLLSLLDAWSHGLAMRKAEKRRRFAQQR